MINSIHYIELFINGEQVELENQDSLNLRINNVLFNPTQTSTKQAEYSYSFEIPSTPVNDKIFDYANNLSKLNKFHARYSCQVYADGTLIFDGSLTIQKYSARDKMYTCNLVNIKINTLDEIFGDMKMTDLKWMVDYEGASTINAVNADGSTKYFFPLVSYGVFQKNYITKDEVGATYTPKHDLDKYNKWWNESFYPSLNVMEVMRRAFESKGYTVGGNVFSDPIISNIYASCNLADEQNPNYNLGNPKFGKVDISFTWNNYESFNKSVSRGRMFENTDSGGLVQDLKFPYGRVLPAINASNGTTSEEYNFSAINMWNMMDSTNNPSGVTVSVSGDTYMYDPNEQLIVIPSDGWYKIYLQADARLSGVGTTFTAQQWTNTYIQGDEFKRRSVQFKRGLKEHTPLEIQLIRNYDENVELIHGTNQIEYKTGDPNQEIYTYANIDFSNFQALPNKEEWRTDFPHQDLYGSKSPTIYTGLVQTTQEENRSGGFNMKKDENGLWYGFDGASRMNTYGYMHRNGYVMPYDQAVSQAFICGFSSLGDGTVSVMRDGKSWSRMCDVNNDVFANVKGMDLVNKVNNSGDTITLETEYCKNDYLNANSYVYSSESVLEGVAEACVYLHRNDILEVVAVQRDFDNYQTYATSASCRVVITAMSERSKPELKADPYWQYNSQTEFPTQLNLFNFTNNETLVNDWIDHIKTAFNLDIVQDGMNIDINTNKGINKDISYAIDIDDRVYNGDVETQYINYPRDMSVRYKIDTEEWGFELTVPAEHINDEGDEWKKWGDSGFTIIQLNDDSYNTTSKSTTTDFSYTYYDSFNWKEVLQNGTESGVELEVMIPVIEKAEYMAEGYGYDEAMQHDGYSMAQRFWFRGQPSQEYVWFSSHMREMVYLCYPTNVRNGFNLSYKDSEKSLLTEYFNVYPMLSSNFIEVDAYLTPQEFESLKGGALIHFDEDLYYTSEIQGYDPSGGNPTTLKLIKKV